MATKKKAEQVVNCASCGHAIPSGTFGTGVCPYCGQNAIKKSKKKKPALVCVSCGKVLAPDEPNLGAEGPLCAGCATPVKTKKSKKKVTEEELDPLFAEEQPKKTHVKKPKAEPAPVVAVEIGWSGSGWGNYTQGRELVFADLTVDMIVLEESHQFHSRNVVKIVAPPPTFVLYADRKYGIFVDPADHRKLRFQSDQMFCVWNFDVDIYKKRKFFEAQS